MDKKTIDQLCINTIRFLSVDAVEKAKSGHPGTPMGAAPMAYILWDLAMRKGDIVFVAACSYFTPILSTSLCCLYLEVTAGVSLWLGCALIVAGSILSWASVSDRETRPAS